MGLAAFNRMRRRAAEQDTATDVATEDQVAVVDLTASADTEPEADGEQGAAADTATDVATALPAWTLKQSPAEYLKRTPEGRHAALARQILAAGA